MSRTYLVRIFQIPVALMVGMARGIASKVVTGLDLL